MLIRDILKLKGGTIHSVAPAATLKEAIALMVGHDIGSLVVIDAGRMIGMLTFREVLKALDAAGGLGDLTARDIMVADPVCGDPGHTIDELRDIMIRHHVRYLPVTEHDSLLGVVSFHDAAKAIIRETAQENRLLRRYIEEAGPTDSRQ